MRGDEGKNPLDAACKQHDIAYDENTDSKIRLDADKKLKNEAMKRIFAKDASLGERAAASGVVGAMKLKRSLTKIGMGISMKIKSSDNKKVKKNSYITFPNLIKSAESAIKKNKPDDINSAIKVAVASIKKRKVGKRIKKPRTIKIPNTYSGSALQLIPIFAGLSALGSFASSVTGVVNGLRQFQNAKQNLIKNKHLNGAMQNNMIGNKSGNGFYLHASKSGNGFYLAPNVSKNH